MQNKFHSTIIGWLLCLVAWIGTANSQYTADDLFLFLNETYDQKEKKLNDFLIDELQQFIWRFPESSNAPIALYMSSMIYLEQRKSHAAVASLLKASSLYPHSHQFSVCTDTLKKILKKNRQQLQYGDKLLTLLVVPSDSLTFKDKYFKYLQILVLLNESDLREWTLKEFYQFFKYAPDYIANDQVLKWTGDWLLKDGQVREAEATYLKLEYLFPTSSLLPLSRIARGKVLFQKLGKPVAATLQFQDIVEKHAGNEVAGTAMFYLGQIYEEKLRKYPEAIKNYQQLVDVHPGHSFEFGALWAIANINEKKLKKYSAAITALDTIVARDTQERKQVVAQKRIGEIYEKQLKQYQPAALNYAKIAMLYPGYSEASEMLLKAGILSYKKAKDPHTAILYFKTILKKFPGSPEIRDTQKHISEIYQNQQNKSQTIKLVPFSVNPGDYKLGWKVKGQISAQCWLAGICGNNFLLFDLNGDEQLTTDGQDGLTILEFPFVVKLSPTLLLPIGQYHLNIQDENLQINPQTLAIPGKVMVDTYQLTEMRIRAGLAPVLIDNTASQHCALHCDYLKKNRISNGMALHEENTKHAKYTPEGAKAGKNSDLYPKIKSYHKALKDWYRSVWHGAPIIDPALYSVGVALKHDVAMLYFYKHNQAETDYFVHPADGATGIPLKFSVEIPNPVLGSDNGRGRGYPILMRLPQAWLQRKLMTVMVIGEEPVKKNIGAATEIIQRNIAGTISCPAQPANPDWPTNSNCAVFIPKNPLALNTKYRVKFVFEDDPKPIEWEFWTIKNEN